MDGIINKVLIIFSILSVLMFNAHAENKIEKLPKLDSKNKINKIDKPVAKEIRPLSNKIKSEKLYTYTAIFVGPITSKVENLDGVKWSCTANSNTCVAKVSWTNPSVKSCNELAQAKNQHIKTYGFGLKKLTKSQLSQCNQLVEVNKNTIAINKAKKPSLHKPLNTTKSFDTNKNKKVLGTNSENKSMTPSMSSNVGVDTGLQRPTTKGLGLSKGIAATSGSVSALMLSKINSFDQLKGAKELKNNDLQRINNKSRSNAYGGYGRRISGEDCDDTRRDANPNATEICDGIDNNCDGRIDEGQTLPYFLDADGDTHGDPTRRMDVCPDEITRAANEGRWLVPVGNDCDDADPDRWNNCE